MPTTENNSLDDYQGKWLVLFPFLMALLLAAYAPPIHAQETNKPDDTDVVESPAPAQTVTGKELMTNAERETMRQHMRSAKTEEERTRLRAENHAKMQQRAQARGLTLRGSPNHQPRAEKHRGGKGPRHKRPCEQNQTRPGCQRGNSRSANASG